MVAFSPMRDLLLLAKNLFIAATKRGLRKHFAHFQANGGRKISEGEQILSELKLNFVLTLPSHQEIVFTAEDAHVIATAAHDFGVDGVTTPTGDTGPEGTRH